MRPKQWTKNLFVFAGLLFTLDSKHTATDFLYTFFAFIIFCIVSGSIYIINDIVDVEFDKMHIQKKNRPIASSILPISTARSIAVIMATSAILISYFLDFKFGIVVFCYIMLMIAYSYGIKNIIIIDVLVIASGFVLRAVAGAAIIDVDISSWLLVCTIFIALFIGFGKRREELAESGKYASDYRATLSEYTTQFLDQLMMITAAGTIMSYSLYTFLSDTGNKHPYMYITLVFVIYGIFRYLYLTGRNAGAKSPELLLINDKPLLVNFILWVISCVFIIYLC